MANTDRFLLEKAVRELTGLSRSQRWRLEKENLFPRRRRIGKRRVGWLQSEIADWVRTRPFQVRSS